jgi:hypothetical protein
MNRQETEKYNERVNKLKNELDDMSDAVTNGLVGDAMAVGYRTRAIQILKELGASKVAHEITTKFLAAAARTAGFPYTPGAGANRVDVEPSLTQIAPPVLEGADAPDRNLVEAITTGSTPSKE